MPKVYKADDVFRLLRKHDKRFTIYVDKGKGSHRTIYHPDVKGSPRSYPVPYHKGRDLQRGYIVGIIRRFELPDGVFN
jgi:predicted RNA binding protein YcfA (HicA-like mRNA interferase family)